MRRAIVHVMAGAIGGALTGVAALLLLYARAPMFTLNPAVTAVVRGVYPTERAGEQEFSWTGPAATLALTGLDRHVDWTCRVSLRGSRQDPSALPVVTATADARPIATVKTTNDYRPWTFVVPADPSVARTVLTLTASTSFIPGPGDRRELGFQIAQWSCDPARGAFVRPPARALAATAVAAAVWGAALGAMGLAAGWLAATIAVVAVGQAAVLVRGFGVFLPYAWTMTDVAAIVAGAMFVLVFAIARATRTRIVGAPRFAIVCAAVTLDLKVAALLHPAKALIDALFHAHRLEWVMAGKLFFTQPLASGVVFPYAIGLYVFAEPWAILTHNHVALLDTIVAASEAIAGALLYVMVARTDRDRCAGALAVLLFSCVPVAYDVVGHANLTNAFGQSVALAAVAVITARPLAWRPVWALVAVIVLTTLALVSHVSTGATLGVALAALALLYALAGGARLRPAAVVLAAVTIVAVVLAIVLYYGHFMDAYRSVLRARAAATAQTSIAGGAVTAGSTPSAAAGIAPLATRTVHAIALTVQALGWPIVVLAIIGLWRLWRERARDRAALAIAAWGVSFVIFLALGIAAPVDASNQRYAVEFVSRAVYGAYPAAVLLAALGAAWAWRANLPLRGAAAVLVAAAIVFGVRTWLGWLA